MNYRVKVTIIAGDPKKHGDVCYLVNESTCHTELKGGHIFTEDEAQITFEQFNKNKIWRMELLPTDDLTTKEFREGYP